MNGSPLSCQFLHGFRRPNRSVAWLRQKIDEDSDQRTGPGKAQTGETETMTMTRGNIGSDFDDFLAEEGLLESSTAVAVKRVVAWQIERKMSEANLTKSEMARLMSTSRSSLDRLLDPENVSVTLKTLQSAVRVLGGRLRIECEFPTPAA